MISYIISELLMLPVACYLVSIKVKHGMYNQKGFFTRYFKTIVVNLVPLFLATGLATLVLMVNILKLISFKKLNTGEPN